MSNTSFTLQVTLHEDGNREEYDKMLKQAQAIAGKIVQEGRRNNITSFFIDDNPQSISDFANANPILLSKEDTELILSYIETDGFNYTFTSKSSFDNIENADFHKLRLAYLGAEDGLEDYLKMCAKHHGIQF